MPASGAADTATTSGNFSALAPSRLLDTRNGVGAPTAPLAAGHSLAVQVTGLAGVPAGAAAVALNITALSATQSGYLIGWADGTPRAHASILNFTAHQDIANEVVLPIGSNGKIDLYNGATGTVHLIADIAGYYLAPLAITTTALPGAVAGLAYKQVLAVTGGVAPYTWTVSGLPAGLSLSSDGIVSGTPSAPGDSTPTFTVTDAGNTIRSSNLGLSVPTAVPAECSGKSCSLLTPDGETVHIPATRIGAISRDTSGVPTQVLLTGDAPSTGQILVLAPTADAPSGLIVVVNGASANSDGTTTVDVSPATPADAYADGTVHALGSPTSAPLAVQPRPATAAGKMTPGVIKPKPKPKQTRLAPRSNGLSNAALDCDSGQSSSLHGLSVSPSLTPSLAALWKHPFFGGGGVYVGTGGLSLYQFDLDGSITLNFGVSVSGSATCTLSLPSLVSTVPAGALGAVILSLDPKITLQVNGQIDIRTSVTFRCGAEYRWSQGQTSRVSYCRQTAQPLQLSAGSGIDATLTASLDASVTLDDVVGITGNLSGSLHAAYNPTGHPVAELRGKVAYDLGACLACFWSGSPLEVSLVSGVIFDKTLLSFDTAPAPAPAPGPPTITAATLPTGTVGQPYATRLTTADNRNGTWSVAAGQLPDGLILDGDLITGKPTGPQTASFTIDFVDGDGRQATANESITVTSTGGGGTGAVQDLAYCRQNTLSANDDDSTQAVSLPFALKFYGSIYSEAYVSNNGYLVFDYPSNTYTPYPMVDESPVPIIAPFFADVDTRNPSSALVTYGSSPDGKTFCVDWVGVGYYSEHADKFNSFQLLLTDRSDVSSGDFDITFNYGPMTWETGDANGGTGGIGGIPARAGFSAGTGNPGSSDELAGSGVTGALLDGGAQSLAQSSRNAGGVPGRDIFTIRN